MPDTLSRRLDLATTSDLQDLLQDLKVKPSRWSAASDQAMAELISSELRAVAGNSMMNLVRRRQGHELAYRQILVDVADKLAPSFRWTAFKVSGPETDEQIEDHIKERVQQRVMEILEKAPEAERSKLQAGLERDLRNRGLPEAVVTSSVSMLMTGVLTGSIASQLIARMLFGGLWTTIFGFSMANMLIGGVAVGGPVGVAVGALVVATGPSYSKTIPAVYRLIMIRENASARSNF
jgi:uncharacterized protein YaaW (UPF0174 family)